MIQLRYKFRKKEQNVLADGIYEQIVNTRISSELAQLDLNFSLKSNEIIRMSSCEENGTRTNHKIFPEKHVQYAAFLFSLSIKMRLDFAFIFARTNRKYAAL